MNTNTTQWVSCADAAKLARAELAKHFQGSKFSIRSSTYAGGASIRIAWNRGPRAFDVEQVVHRFAGAKFDGSTDSMHYHDELQCASDGNIVSVRYASDFVFCERGYGDARRPTDRDYGSTSPFVSEIEAWILERCQCERVGSEWRYGSCWVSGLAASILADVDFRNETSAAAFERWTKQGNCGPLRRYVSLVQS